MNDGLRPLLPIQTGTATPLERGTWLAIAALAAGAGAAAAAGAASAPLLVWMGATAWTGAALTLGWDRRRRRARQRRPAVARRFVLRASEYGALSMRDHLRGWSLLTLLVAAAAQLDWPAALLSWGLKAGVALLALNCVRVLVRAGAAVFPAAYPRALMLAEVGSDGARVTIEVALAPSAEPVRYDAVLELLAVARDQDPEEGLRARVVDAVPGAAVAFDQGRLCLVFHPVSEHIFTLGAQAASWWRFTASGGPDYLLARLVLRGAGRCYCFEWR
jgi:hypothetical protein